MRIHECCKSPAPDAAHHLLYKIHHGIDLEYILWDVRQQTLLDHIEIRFYNLYPSSSRFLSIVYAMQIDVRSTICDKQVVRHFDVELLIFSTSHMIIYTHFYQKTHDTKASKLLQTEVELHSTESRSSYSRYSSKIEIRKNRSQSNLEIGLKRWTAMHRQMFHIFRDVRERGWLQTWIHLWW